MKCYQVLITEHITSVINVDAEDEDDAIQEAWDHFEEKGKQAHYNAEILSVREKEEKKNENTQFIRV